MVFIWIKNIILGILFDLGWDFMDKFYSFILWLAALSQGTYKYEIHISMKYFLFLN